MSYSEVTVLKIVGAESVFLRDLITKVQEMPESDRCNEELMESLLGEHINRILVQWSEPSAIYAVKYMDNDAVAADQLHFIHTILTREGMCFAFFIYAGAINLLVLMTEKPFDIQRLRSISRRNAICKQTSQRRLFSNIIEACAVWNEFSAKAIILVIEKPLGPTVLDDEVRTLIHGDRGI